MIFLMVIFIVIIATLKVGFDVKISNLKNGKTKLENLTLRVASELTTFSKGLQKGV